MTHSINKIFTIISIFLLVSGMSLKPAVGQTNPTASPPNIVIILTDDQGYHDVGYNQNPNILTPHIDQMAQEGAIFTNFYSAAPTCTASRAGLLTGCYPPRVGLTWVLFPESKSGLNPQEVTMAEMLKANGYATALSGKWHLGNFAGVMPNDQGFDEYYGIPYSNNLFPGWGNRKNNPPLPVYRNRTVVEENPDQSLFTQKFTSFAIDFIEQNRNNPFFLLLAHPMPHVPLAVSDKFEGKSGLGLYADVILEIDWSVGQILKTLNALSIEENTLVIFTSDNGPWLEYGTHAGSAFPLRNGKFSSFEGGQRVPGVMWWPGRIPRGSVVHEPISAIDLLPTVAAITESNLPKNKLDGKNVWPTIADQEPVNRPLYYFVGNQLEAIRRQSWKFHLPHQFREEQPGQNGEPGGFEWQQINTSLFNLEKDIDETANFYRKYDTTVNMFLHLQDSITRDIAQDSLRRSSD